MKLQPLAVPVLVTICALGAAAGRAAANDPQAAPPQRALAIDSGNVTNYAVRIRASGALFDKAKLAVRDLLATFTEPRSTQMSNFYSPANGFNTILDAGYLTDIAQAGGVRTTPLQMMWSWRSDTCPDGTANCLAEDREASKRMHWMQSRSPEAKCIQDERVIVNQVACDAATYGAANAGGILCNQNGVPPYWFSNFRENGFYVSNDGKCYEEQNVCMTNRGLSPRPDGGDPGGWCMDDVCTPHQAKELGVVCDMVPQWAPPANEVYMNVGVFIFPNGLVESAGAGAAFASPVPVWARPVTLNYNGPGDYFGYVPKKRYGVYTGRGTAGNLRSSGADGTYTWKASAFPTQAAYDPTAAYSDYFGSYFRAGDDIAFYADVRQMQIHAIDRDVDSKAAYGEDAVNGCGYGPVYTGELEAGTNMPKYFWARVPQCLRPKSYWHGPPNVPAASAMRKWVACNPYDSYLSDGSLNPARDDGYVIYPGNDATKKCGTQVAGNPLSPLDSGGQGTGWSALRLNTFSMDTTNNKIDFNLSGYDWRLELALYWAFATECMVAVSYTTPSCDSKPGYQLKRKWATGAMMIKDLQVAGSAKLYSIDEHSCTAANGDCTAPWGQANDNLIRPDRVYIDLQMPTLAINMYPDPAKGDWGGGWGTQRNSYRAIYGDLSGYGRSCFAEVYGECAFSMARWDDPGSDGDLADPELILPQVTDAIASEFNTQFRDMIEGQIDTLNEGLPGLSTVLGDPWNMGSSLVEVGVFVTGSNTDGIADPTKTSRRIWPIPFKAPPAGRSPVIDVNATLGFRPIAFESPIPANKILVVDDPADGIAATSFYAAPKMVYPDTSSCQLTIKGAGATSVSTPGGTVPSWAQTGTQLSYANDTGWLSGLGTPSPNRFSGDYFGQTFFNRSNWKFGIIRDVHKDQSMSPTNAYRIDEGRGASPGDGSFSATAQWGVSNGWLQVAAPTAPRTFTDIRVGDQFFFDAYPTAMYTIIAVGTATNRAIQLDFPAGAANRSVPFQMDGSKPYTIISRSCSRSGSLYPSVVTDRDYGDYALDRTFSDSKTSKSYAGRDVISPYFVADNDMKTTKAWCAFPVRAKEDADGLAARFPMKTWLSFDTSDAAPAGFNTSQSLPNPSTYTLGAWDYLKRKYDGTPPSEQITMSDVQIDAAATIKNGWVSTTANVGAANGARAERSTNRTDSLTSAFTTQAPGEDYNVWVAHSRVLTTVPADTAHEQITHTDGDIYGAATAKGGWVPTSQAVTNSNQGGALRATALSDTLTESITTQSPSVTFNVWVAHSRVDGPYSSTPERQLISRSDDVMFNASSSRGTWARTTGNMSTANGSTTAGAMRSTARTDTITTPFTTSMPNASFGFYFAASRVHYTTGCGGFLQPSCKNATLDVSIDGTVQTTVTLSADNSFAWFNGGIKSLSAGNHTITFKCTVSDDTSRCGVDGVVLSSEGVNPTSDARYLPYGTANWDAAALSYYYPYDSGWRADANTTLAVSIDGTAVGSVSQTADDTWTWTKVGTKVLAAGAHTVTYTCTAANNNRCAVDGLVLTTETTTPNTDPGFTPYTTQDWDATSLSFYWPPTGTIVNTYLSVYIDGVKVGNTLTESADNTWAWAKLGTTTLLQGAHTIRFDCDAASDRRCGVDGILITTQTTDPSTAAGYTPYASANWDAAALDFYNPTPPGTPVRGVVRANQNDYGLKEPGNVNYDASIHIHQRTLNQLAMAVVGSGSGCLEFSDTDPETGSATLWADFMTVDRFAAFMPEAAAKFKGWKLKLRVVPTRSPRVRTGIGSLDVTPSTPGSANITAEPYTVAAAFPDLQLSFVAVDPKTSNEVNLFRLNWSVVVGMYLRAMRQCHTLDPMKNDPACTSLDPWVRTVSGYWQLYVDYGNPTLSAYFEKPTNTLDAFEPGRFTLGDFVCPECSPAIAKDTAKFEMLEVNCGAGCNKLGLANSITTLLDSTASLFFETRASTTFLALPLNLDFLYIGPDGPNDDALGTNFAGSRGDYLGIYARLFGKQLDLMGLVNGLTAALGAPPSSIIPQAAVPALAPGGWVTTSSPSFETKLLNPAGDVPEGAAYTYRLDGGFWRTPRAEPRIELTGLTEGSHRLELRGMAQNDQGWVNQLEPTLLHFVVDSLAPALSIPPAPAGAYRAYVPVEASDLQTPGDQLKLEYSLDDAEWQAFDDLRVPLRGAEPGRHTLRVRATDLAGNTAAAAREIVVAGGDCGCGAAGAGEAGGFAALALLLWAARRRLQRRRCS